MAYSKQNFQNGQILNAANLEAMENGIIAGQGAKNLLVNSDFRNPIDIDNKIGTKNADPCFTRWNIERANSNTTTQIIKIDNGIRVYKNGGIARFYQSCNYNLLGKIVSYAVGTTEGVFVGSCSVDTSSVFTRIGTHTGYISVYYSSTREKTIFSLYFNNNSEDAIDLYWAALYEGAYTKETLPNYVPKDRHVEMLNCGVPLQPYNLLDNSDFTNPVNSQGKTSYTGAGNTIDRWKAGVSDCSMYVNAGQSVAFNTKTEGVNAYWRQYLPHSFSQLEGKTFTLAIKDAWGKTHCASGVYPTSAPSATKSVIWINMYDNISIVLYCETNGTAFVQLTTKKSVPIVWVTLYEGSYTADTLPSYVPKGKRVEMLNCGVSLAPYNLLDNSDFRNPVNQRGRSGTYEGVSNYTTFVIDRWKTWSTGCTYALSSAGLQIANLNASSSAGPWEALPNHEQMEGKTYTLAVGYNGGNVACGNVAVPTGTLTEDKYLSAVSASGTRPGLRFVIPSDYSRIEFQILISVGQTVTVEWAALYEGSYDASTLPAYQPKGYAAELAECQRYFERLGGTFSQTLGNAVFAKAGAKSVIISIKYSPKRLSNPTLSLSAPSEYRMLQKDAVNASTISAYSITSFDNITTETPFAFFRVNLADALSSDSWLILQRADGATGAYIDVNADM